MVKQKGLVDREASAQAVPMSIRPLQTHPPEAGGPAPPSPPWKHILQQSMRVHFVDAVHLIETTTSKSVSVDSY